jgi:EmrB/QacA subfamily drug resistance transporter
VTRARSILLLCCVAQFMVILDVSVVNVALPSIRTDLGFSQINLQWVVNGYTLTLAGFLLLGGRAADLLGDRRVFIAGLAAFTGASLVGALANQQLVLIIARGFQGIGGAVVTPVTLSILTTTFAEGQARNRALAAWSAMGGVGGTAGVLLGGVLTEVFGWRSILLINVPVGIAAGITAYRFVTNSREHSGERNYDLAGAATITAGLVLLTYAIVRTDVNGWGSLKTLLPMAVGLMLIGIFILIEGRLARRPLMPLRIFRSRTLTSANAVIFFLGASAFSMWFFVSLYMQQVLHYSPIEAGLGFAPMGAFVVVGSTVAGRLAGRFGPGRVLTVGMAMMGVGLLIFSGVDAHGSYVEEVLVPGLITACGIGVVFVSGTVSAVAGVRRSETGLASGLVNTSRTLGASLGIAVLATIASARTASAPVHGAEALVLGYQRAFLVGSMFAFAGAFVALAFLAGRVKTVPSAATAAADGQSTSP